jgi:hypothetical protein
MAAFSWRIRPQGITELQRLIEHGMEAGAEVVADRARANIAPYRNTGAVEDSIHLNTEHLSEWPDPVVFVSTASGDGYWVEMGTVDTPARLFLSQALDSTARDLPRLMRQSSQAGMGRSLDILNREFSADQAIRRE